MEIVLNLKAKRKRLTWGQVLNKAGARLRKIITREQFCEFVSMKVRRKTVVFIYRIFTPRPGLSQCKIGARQWT
jgi:hypothetical protein